MTIEQNSLLDRRFKGKKQNYYYVVQTVDQVVVVAKFLEAFATSSVLYICFGGAMVMG
jgi:hypothetical protein